MINNFKLLKNFNSFNKIISYYIFKCGGLTQIPVNYYIEESITIRPNHKDLILELNKILWERLKSKKVYLLDAHGINSLHE